jgi:hypothetical protein
MECDPHAAPRGIRGMEIEMARTTINTHNVGPLTFFAPDGGGYVRLESPGKSGTLGQQICEGGDTMGSTLTANASNLGAVARRWLRQRRANEDLARLDDSGCGL